jgi:hypothetical protein
MKFELFPVTFILNIFSLMQLCAYDVIPPDYVNFNIHRRGNVLAANSNIRHRFSVLLTQYCGGDKIEKNEMGGVCSAYGGGERRV